MFIMIVLLQWVLLLADETLGNPLQRTRGGRATSVDEYVSHYCISILFQQKLDKVGSYGIGVLIGNDGIYGQIYSLHCSVLLKCAV